MIFIPKTSRQDLNNVKAYRPITLTSFQLKVMERVILEYLLPLEGIANTINGNQHAYMAGSSTDSALHALVSRIEETVSEGNYALGIFLDIQGAFDTVSREAILGALRAAGVGEGITKWVSSLLSRRVVEATWGGASTCREIKRGYP